MNRLAWPFPLGSTTLGHLDTLTDEELRRIGIRRIREQVVAVDLEAYKEDGRLRELANVITTLKEAIAIAECCDEICSERGLTKALWDYEKEAEGYCNRLDKDLCVRRSTRAVLAHTPGRLTHKG
jgi:hypothetical protein